MKKNVKEFETFIDTNISNYKIEVINLVNMLIADRNLNHVKDIINNVISKNKNIKLSKIINSEGEINELENSDVMLLNTNLDLSKILKSIKNIENYYNSILVRTPSFKNVEDIIGNKMIYDYIIDGTNSREISYKISKMIETKDKDNKRKEIIKELKYIGYNLEYVGTNYLADTILEIYSSKEQMRDNLQKEIYPIISQKYNKTVHNIKCNINRATDCMYYECDSERLKKYFGFYDDTKPTAKIVAFTVLNKI